MIAETKRSSIYIFRVSTERSASRTYSGPALLTSLSAAAVLVVVSADTQKRSTAEHHTAARYSMENSQIYRLECVCPPASLLLTIDKGSSHACIAS